MKVPFLMREKIKKSDNILLLIILLTAAILRFWDFPHIPYMADELSALMRTHYINLTDFLNNGAQLDTHPIGVQVFLLYWTKVFGYSEMAVKFPFIIAGLLSLYFIYKIAGFWFNNTVGLITASFMATIQYMVMYSQIARPYISGMLFSILMVWCWTNYLFNADSKKTKWLLGYIVFSTLCVYDHYLALLFAATVGLTGIFFLNKKLYKGYIIAGISIFVLFTPHLNLFFYQLSMGGVGEWLGKPRPDWIIVYLEYVFNFSKWMYLLVFSLILMGFIFRNKKHEAYKFRIIALLWFGIQFLIAYYYSVKVNPILQFSTLIFVFPFFLMLLFSMFGALKKTIIVPLVLIILCTGTFTLVFKRHHYKVFYNQPFDKFVTNTYKILDSIGNPENVTIDIFLPRNYGDLYFKKYHRSFNYTVYNQYDNKRDPKGFKTYVNNQKSDYFVTGNLPLEYLSIIKEKYPFIMAKDEGFTYSFYCFTKIKPETEIIETIAITNKTFENADYIKYSADWAKPFFLGKTEIPMDSTMEYTPTFSFKIKEVCAGFKFSIVNMAVDVSSLDTAANTSFVFDLHQGDESIIWTSSDLKKFNNYPTKNTVYLSHIISYQHILDYPDAELRVFVWNRTLNRIVLSNFQFEVIAGNPNIFKLFMN